MLRKKNEHFGVRGHVRALKAATCRRTPQTSSLLCVRIWLPVLSSYEGFYLATSDDVQGLVAQGRTVAETMEIARDVARRLLEAQRKRKKSRKLPQVKKSFDLQLVVAN
jgi:predicted RNase H-like HicB family nuclease